MSVVAMCVMYMCVMYMCVMYMCVMYMCVSVCGCMDVGDDNARMCDSKTKGEGFVFKNKRRGTKGEGFVFENKRRGICF